MSTPVGQMSYQVIHPGAMVTFPNMSTLISTNIIIKTFSSITTFALFPLVSKVFV